VLPKGLLSAVLKKMEGGSVDSIALNGGSDGVGGYREVDLQIEVDLYASRGHANCGTKSI